MNLRKLFRMKHEPCRDTCYAYDDVLKISTLSEYDRERLLERFAALHARACGDSRFGFGLDLDEATGRFVGYVAHPGGTDLIARDGLLDAAVDLLNLADAVLAEAARPNLAACDHGATGDFVLFARRHGGVEVAT